MLLWPNELYFHICIFVDNALMSIRYGLIARILSEYIILTQIYIHLNFIWLERDESALSKYFKYWT